MDITVEVMLPPRGAADYSESANIRYRVLAPVAVYPLKTVDVVGMQRTGYVHVTDIPLRPGWAILTPEEICARISTKLCEVWIPPSEGSHGERRIWAGVASVIPVAARDRLLQDRQITVSWTQFKSVMRHLVELRSFSDADLG